jgi:hypothetical protein
MEPVQAIREGFRGGRASLVAAAHLFGGALAFAWLAAAPSAAALHDALDGQPSAARLVRDGGFEVVEEMSRAGALLLPAVLGSVAPLGVAFLLLAVVLAGGAYGSAVRRPERPLRDFWAAGSGRFAAFLRCGVLSALYAAVFGVAAWGTMAGILTALAEPSGPGAYRALIALLAAVFAVTVLHVRTVLGFAFAHAAMEPDERPLAGFLGAVGFCWRRLPSTHGIGLLFLLLQASSALAGLALARLAGPGGWGAAALAQAGWFGVAWLRVAEIRARVAYASSGAAPRLHGAEGPGGADVLARASRAVVASSEPSLPDRVGEGTDLIEEFRELVGEPQHARRVAGGAHRLRMGFDE